MSRKNFFVIGLLFFFSAFAESWFSFGGSPFTYLNLGTTCEEPELNSEAPKLSDSGFDDSNKTITGAGGNIFARFNMPFFTNLGLEIDFSYFNKNGFTRKFSDSENSLIKYSYFYKSIELSPLVTFTIPYKQFDFTFLAGPEFSFPFGDVEHEYSFNVDKKTEYELASDFIPGLVFGTSAGIIADQIELYLTARYIFDLEKVQYKIEDQTFDLLQRRCLNFGIGIRYILPEKDRPAPTLSR